MKVKKINNLQISDDNLLRYNKHILLDEIDLEGIEVLQQKHIAVIGLGGLGCPIAQYLVTSGLGNITLIDDDYVESTNLQRQILYISEDIGKKKAEAAYKRLSEINPNINIHQYYERFTENSSSLIESADLIIDATDNFKTRSLINKITLSLKKPLVMGAAIKMQGQVAVFRNDLDDMPCYNCLYDNLIDEDTSCLNQGVLSSLTGVIGSIQATEALKILLCFGETLESKLLLVDLKYTSFRIVKIKKDPECRVCK